MSALPYAQAFLPTPAASLAMAEAIQIGSVLTEGLESTKRFWFSVELPPEATVGWFQYIHMRFPKACGWSPYPPPTRFHPYLDPARWEGYNDGADAVPGLAELVVCGADGLPRLLQRLALGGALVLQNTSVQGLEPLFEAVVSVPGVPTVVGLNYLGLGTGAPALALAPAVPPAASPVLATLDPAYWSSLLPTPEVPTPPPPAPPAPVRLPTEETPLSTLPA